MECKQEEEDTIPSAGKGEFNMNLSKELSDVTFQLACYGLVLFKDGIDYTRKILVSEQKRISDPNKEIDGNYEIIDDSLKHLIPNDIEHYEGQVLLMKSDTRIQERIVALLISIGIELPIKDWSWFDIFITGLLKCGTIKIINYIDRDLIGKILLGLCWIIPPFIAHFFDANINQFVSSIVIQIHSTICFLMSVF